MKINRFLQIVFKLLISIVLLTIALLYISCSNNSSVLSLNSDYENIKYELITFLTNNEYDRSKELLNILEKQYAELDRNKKCDYHYYYGCYLFITEKHNLAKQEFDQCLQLNEAYLQAIYSRAELRSNALNNFEGAIKDYEKLLKLLDYCESTNYFTKNSLITIYTISVINYSELPFTRNEYTKDFVSNFGSVTLTPDKLRIRCYIDIIEHYYENKNYRKTIKFIKLARSKKLSYRFTSEPLAECYFELKEYQNAIDAFNNYILFHDETRYINYKLGLSYFFLEDFNKSLFKLNKVLINFKDIENSIINYSPHYSDQNVITKQNQQALKDHQKLFQSALLYRARSYGKLKEYKKGIADLNEVLNLDINDVTGYYYRGYFYNYHGDRELALKDFLKVLSLNPTRNSVNYSVALLYDSKGKFEKAIEYYEEFISNTMDTKSGKYKAAFDRLEKLKL